jgi:hypothetical protein
MATLVACAKTVNEIVSYMKKSITDKDFFDTMRNKAYDFSLNYHWDNTATSFVDFMNIIENK